MVLKKTLKQLGPLLQITFDKSFITLITEEFPAYRAYAHVGRIYVQTFITISCIAMATNNTFHLLCLTPVADRYLHVHPLLAYNTV